MVDCGELGDGGEWAGRGGQQVTASGYSVSLWTDKNVLS